MFEIDFNKECLPSENEEKEMRNRIQLRLGRINQTRNTIDNEISLLNEFCWHCKEDKVFCPCCVIPATTNKLRCIFGDYTTKR